MTESLQSAWLVQHLSTQYIYIYIYVIYIRYIYIKYKSHIYDMYNKYMIWYVYDIYIYIYILRENILRNTKPRTESFLSRILNLMKLAANFKTILPKLWYSIYRWKYYIMKSKNEHSRKRKIRMWNFYWSL